MNSEKGKTADPYKLRLNLANKIKKKKCVIISSLSIYYTWRNTKSYIKK